jgi:hypothetical protein
LRNPRLFRGTVPKILKRDAEAVKVCLETAIDVPLHLDEYIVERAWRSSATDTAAEWAIQARIGPLEEIVDLSQSDGRRMPSENEAARGAAEASHHPSVRE